MVVEIKVGLTKETICGPTNHECIGIRVSFALSMSEIIEVDVRLSLRRRLNDCRCREKLLLTHVSTRTYIIKCSFLTWYQSWKILVGQIEKANRNSWLEYSSSVCLTGEIQNQYWACEPANTLPTLSMYRILLLLLGTLDKIRLFLFTFTLFPLTQCTWAAG